MRRPTLVEGDTCSQLYSKAIGSEQIPKSTIVAHGKMPGSEHNHDHDHDSVAGQGAPSCDALRHKCSVMRSGRELNSTGAELS